jgi:hypothetical protein
LSSASPSAAKNSPPPNLPISDPAGGFIDENRRLKAPGQNRDSAQRDRVEQICANGFLLSNAFQKQFCNFTNHFTESGARNLVDSERLMISVGQQ